MTRGPIRVGFVGAGNVLPAYLQTLDRLESAGLAEAGAIAVRRPEARETLLQHRPGALVVDRVEKVMESNADIVVILTPPQPRVALTAAALNAGKHVLSEKPLGTSRQVVEPLVDLAVRVDRLLYMAPFVHLSPTFRALWTRIHRGDIGKPHSARAMYGNLGASWAPWVHDPDVGPLAEIGVYNLKSLVLLLGPVISVVASETEAIPRTGTDPSVPGSPDVINAVLRHEGGALSSVLVSYAVHAYRRPAIEIYGLEGTANLLGDDWDPAGFEIWRAAGGYWEMHEPPDDTWLWTDGLREMVSAVAEDRLPLGPPEIDLHILDIVTSARGSAKAGGEQAVGSRPAIPDLTIEIPKAHAHDRTRPIDQQ